MLNCTLSAMAKRKVDDAMLLEECCDREIRAAQALVRVESTEVYKSHLTLPCYGGRFEARVPK